LGSRNTTTHGTTATSSATTATATTTTRTLPNVELVPLDEPNHVSLPYPSLYCWLVMMAEGYELDMVRSHFHRGYSIFGCDQFKVFEQGTRVDDVDIALDVTPLGDLQASVFGDGGSWSNTAIFMQAWKLIADDGEYRVYDWVVKVDPDTVFHPARLKKRLLAVPPGSSTYLQNCVGYPTIGALEVFSREAVTAYLQGSEGCEDLVVGSAEDYFICKCMERLGVQRRRDLMLLRHEQPGGCEDPSVVAFHPYKDADEYAACAGAR